MNRIIFILLLSLSPAVYAGGSWGGGSPPLTYSELIRTAPAEVMSQTVEKGEESMMPRLSADDIFYLGNDAIILPVSDVDYNWIIKRIMRAGEATVVLDNGEFFKFVSENCYPADPSKLAKVMNIEVYGKRIPNCVCD